MAHLATMHWAVTQDGIEQVQSLWEQQPDSLNELDDAGHPPLYTAALYGNHEAIEFLLDHGAQCDLFAYAYLNEIEEAATLIRMNPAAVNHSTPAGMTALHYAARAGHVEMAKLLIEHGANVDATDDRGRTPLLEASHCGPWKRKPSRRIVTLLVEHGASIDLHTAAAIGSEREVEKFLVDSRQPINAINDLGQTALHLAAKNDQLKIVRLLVKQGADVNISDPVGIAALHRTSQECLDETVQFLIDNGANAHAACYAACGDEVGLRRALERAPQQIEETLYEFKPVGYAIHSWQLGALRVLMEFGASLSDDDRQHIIRISDGDNTLLDELLELRNEKGS